MTNIFNFWWAVYDWHLKVLMNNWWDLFDHQISYADMCHDMLYIYIYIPLNLVKCLKVDYINAMHAMWRDKVMPCIILILFANIVMKCQHGCRSSLPPSWVLPATLTCQVILSSKCFSSYFTQMFVKFTWGRWIEIVWQLLEVTHIYMGVTRRKMNSTLTHCMVYFIEVSLVLR